MKTRITIMMLASLFIVSGLMAQEEANESRILQLKLGPAQLRSKVISVRADKIYSAREGKEISFEKMISEMKDCLFVYVGETHDSLPIHDIQSRIAQALFAQNRNLAIGLEMFDITRQTVLNKWSLGLLPEEEFIREAEWYVAWNFNYNFYKKIFDLASDNKLPVYALNAPRDIITKIRMQGWDALTDTEKTIVPKPDLTITDHRTLIKAILGDMEMPAPMKGHGGGEVMFDGLYRAQSAWDEVMAFNAIRAAEVENRRVIVFAGSGHLLYNLGINRRVFERSPVPSRTVICVTVPGAGEGLDVSAGLADYIWGIPEEDKPAYPSNGLALKMFEGLANPVVERDPISGAAVGQDFKKGDVILSVNGRNFQSVNDLRTYLSRFTWNDEIKFRLLREAKVIDAVLKLQNIEAKKAETRDGSQPEIKKTETGDIPKQETEKAESPTDAKQKKTDKKAKKPVKKDRKQSR